MCENRRVMELSKDIGHRPIVLIRFNPDSYIKDGETIKSCWETQIRGLHVVKKSKEKEWEDRLKLLKATTEYWLKNQIDKTIELVTLFMNS
jgi:hypothetical protein